MFKTTASILAPLAVCAALVATGGAAQAESPTAPTFHDATCAAPSQGSVDIPADPGVLFYIDAADGTGPRQVEAGTYPLTANLTVTVRGYNQDGTEAQFTDGIRMLWTVTPAQPSGCTTPTSPATATIGSKCRSWAASYLHARREKVVRVHWCSARH